MPYRTAAEKQRLDAEFAQAVKNYEAAVRFLQKENYEKAMELLEKIVASPAREVADRARVHLRLCAQKLNRSGPALKTAADYYDYGISQLNARNLESALEHFARADRLAPEQDHIRYALAAVHAQLGNSDAALEHLKAAVTLRPANRFQARRDEDFQPLENDPRFRQLVYSSGNPGR